MLICLSSWNTLGEQHGFYLPHAFVSFLEAVMHRFSLVCDYTMIILHIVLELIVYCYSRRLGGSMVTIQCIIV